MKDEVLRGAVKYVNTVAGRHSAQPLLEIATCDFEKCGVEFPMQVQDYSRAKKHGFKYICPDCRPKYHRSKRKVEKK